MAAKIVSYVSNLWLHAAAAKVCKHYFHMLVLKQSNVDKNIDP